MSKRILYGLLGGIGLVLSVGGPVWAQVTTLTFAHLNSPTGWGPVHAFNPWIKRVEEASRGKVKIQVYPAQTLVKGPDSWNAIKSGVVDMAFCFHGFWPDLTPLSDVISLPTLPVKTADKGSEVLWKLYEKFPAIQREFQDVKVLALWTSDPYFLITTKKQIKTLEDIKGMKIRVTGGPPTEQMKALGGVPILIPTPDTYQSLDKGVVDGMTAPWEPIHGYRLVEVVKYYTMIPLNVTYFSMAMNKDKWNSLPKDVQDAIMSVGGLEGSKFLGRNYFDAAEGGVMELAKSGNHQMTRYVLPPEEQARWTKVAGEPLWAEWVKKMEARGRPEARQILNATLEMLKN